jgi:DNA mismatch repair protein MutL
MKHKYPTAVLNFEIDPDKIDVNIHPTKIQVRFEEEKMIQPALVSAVRAVLDRTDLIPELTLEADHERPPHEIAADGQSVITPKEEEMTTVPDEAVLEQTYTRSVEIEHVQLELEQQETIEEDQKDRPMREFSLDKKLELLTNIKPLAQLHDSYILVQAEQGLVIIDQHALHERVMYEKLRSMYETERSIKQELISPVSFEYNSRDFEILISYGSNLKDLGFEIEPFGKNTILVRAVPTVFGRMEDREVINDILDDLLSMGRVRGEELQREKFIQIMACKAAIKAGQRLSMHEIVQLLKMIPDLNSPFNCAHGRPTILSMPLKELEKQFKRTGQ